MKGPTAESMLENLFRFAIEAEDIPTVKHLIKAGANPNGHICRHPQIPDELTPLQFAYIHGNTELAQHLIKAGSSIDQPGSGWKSSALVLPIIGVNLRGDEDFWALNMWILTMRILTMRILTMGILTVRILTMRLLTKLRMLAVEREKTAFSISLPL